MGRITKGGVMRSNSSLWAYILIVLGVFFLLSNLGLIPNFGEILAKWWPLILIALGINSLVQRSMNQKQ
jgi:hypothetical protein